MTQLARKELHQSPALASIIQGLGRIIKMTGKGNENDKYEEGRIKSCFWLSKLQGLHWISRLYFLLYFFQTSSKMHVATVSTPSKIKYIIGILQNLETNQYRKDKSISKQIPRNDYWRTFSLSVFWQLLALLRLPAAGIRWNTRYTSTQGWRKSRNNHIPWTNDVVSEGTRSNCGCNYRHTWPTVSSEWNTLIY